MVREGLQRRTNECEEMAYGWKLELTSIMVGAVETPWTGNKKRKHVAKGVAATPGYFFLKLIFSFSF